MWGEVPEWYCGGCGRPQAGPSPWLALGGARRCRTCGPGDGYARCPYGLGVADGCTKRCLACKGINYVEVI